MAPKFMNLLESFHELWINPMKLFLQAVRGKVKLQGNWKVDQEECNQKCNEARKIAPLKRDIEDSIYFFFFGYYQKLYIPKYSINTTDKPPKVHFKAKVYHILTFMLINLLVWIFTECTEALILYLFLPMKISKNPPSIIG